MADLCVAVNPVRSCFRATLKTDGPLKLSLLFLIGELEKKGNNFIWTFIQSGVPGD